jgi:hypothetical protein
MLRRTLVGLSAALTVLLAGATTAPAAPDNRPLRLWSFSTVKHGVGKVKLASGGQQGGLLRKQRTFGGAAFAFPESKPREKATGNLFSTASG